MSAETIGLISGLLVTISAVPYAYRVYERKITTVPTSWALWTFIGLALLLTYRSSGATANIWPAIFGFTNPLIITALSAWRGKRRWTKPTRTESICLVMGMIALTAWLFVHDDKRLAQYALYVAILADLCAAVPTAIFLWHEPWEDRPLMWGLFGIGYILSIFAITDNTFSNYILPIYMFSMSAIITVFLARYRVRQQIPFREWI